MNLIKTVRCKLQVSPEGERALRDTLHAFADACNYALDVALERGIARRYSLHKVVYYDLREEFGLTANLACQAIRRVMASIKAAKKRGRKPRHFEPKSVDYDQRIFSFREKDWSISISTLHGRKRFKLRISGYQRGLLKGQDPHFAVLTYDKFNCRYFIHITLEKEVIPPSPSGPPVGVDLNHHPMIAASNGFTFHGTEFLRARRHFAQLRKSLQRKGTKGAKRLLRRLSGKERRVVKHHLHVATRRLVDSLEPKAPLVFEDLTHIRERTTVRKRQRYQHNSWSFQMAQRFAEYKALETGHATLYVDPSYSSQECSRCGCINKRNRRSTKLFRCVSCGFQHNTWTVASYNLACRAGSASLGPSDERYTAVPPCNPALNQRVFAHS